MKKFLISTLLKPFHLWQCQSNSLESYRFLEFLIWSKWHWVLVLGQDQIEPTVYKLDSCTGLVTDAIISSLSLSVLRNSEIMIKFHPCFETFNGFPRPVSQNADRWIQLTRSSRALVSALIHTTSAGGSSWQLHALYACRGGLTSSFHALKHMLALLGAVSLPT